jgi:hypothetical protein
VDPNLFAGLVTLEGFPVYFRRVAMALAYNRPVGWGPAQWLIPYGFAKEAWTHPVYPNHLVNAVDVRHLVVLQRSRAMPNITPALAFGRHVLGPFVAPVNTFCSPLALRIALEDRGTALPIPQDACRCQHVWPDRPLLCDVGGAEIELRISVSKDDGRLPRFCADAFLGNHVALDGAFRAILFLGDTRRVFRNAVPDAAWFAGRMLDRLLMFTRDIERLGLFVDPTAALKLPIFARAKVLRQLGDWAFDVRMPTPYGRRRFLADIGTDGIWPIRTTAELRRALAAADVAPASAIHL